MAKFETVVTREIYWGCQAALFALMLIASFFPYGVFALSFALIAQCFLIPMRLRDAGVSFWYGVAAILASLGGVAMLAWAGQHYSEPGNDGAGLLAAMAAILLVVVTVAGLIVWPGLLASRGR